MAPRLHFEEVNRSKTSTVALGRMTQQRPVLRIVEYLRKHKQAGDTLEGVARWWMMNQQVSDSLTEVQEALEQLNAQGVVAMRKGPDGRTLYFMNNPND